MLHFFVGSSSVREQNSTRHVGWKKKNRIDATSIFNFFVHRSIAYHAFENFSRSEMITTPSWHSSGGKLEAQYVGFSIDDDHASRSRSAQKCPGSSAGKCIEWALHNNQPIERCVVDVQLNVADVSVSRTPSNTTGYRSILVWNPAASFRSVKLRTRDLSDTCAACTVFFAHTYTLVRVLRAQDVSGVVDETFI